MREILYIRADANASLGIGHVMRCATVAQEWERRGGRAVFLAAGQDGASVVQDMGFHAVCLPDARYDDLERELPELVSIIEDREVKLLLLDSYYVTCRYMKELYRRTKVIYLGKFHEEAFPAHMVIDYTIQSLENHAVYERYDALGSKKLLGCDYFPLRREFLGQWNAGAEYHRNAEENHRLHILITTGGSDPFHVAYQLCSRLMDRTEFCIHAVVGAFHADREILKGMSEKNDRLYVYENVKNMAQLMHRCDMAVSAGGITLYELCACGVPTVAYTFADNQQPAVEVFARRGILYSAGDIRSGGDREWCQRIVEKLLFLSENRKARAEMSARMSELIDGRGTERIVDGIEGLCQ